MATAGATRRPSDYEVEYDVLLDLVKFFDGVPIEEQQDFMATNDINPKPEYPVPRLRAHRAVVAKCKGSLMEVWPDNRLMNLVDNIAKNDRDNLADVVDLTRGAIAKWKMGLYKEKLNKFHKKCSLFMQKMFPVNAETQILQLIINNSSGLVDAAANLITYAKDLYKGKQDKFLAIDFSSGTHYIVAVEDRKLTQCMENSRKKSTLQSTGDQSSSCNCFPDKILQDGIAKALFGRSRRTRDSSVTRRKARDMFKEESKEAIVTIKENGGRSPLARVTSAYRWDHKLVLEIVRKDEYMQTLHNSFAGTQSASSALTKAGLSVDAAFENIVDLVLKYDETFTNCHIKTAAGNRGSNIGDAPRVLVSHNRNIPVRNLIIGAAQDHAVQFIRQIKEKQRHAATAIVDNVFSEAWHTQEWFADLNAHALFTYHGRIPVLLEDNSSSSSTDASGSDSTTQCSECLTTSDVIIESDTDVDFVGTLVRDDFDGVKILKPLRNKFRSGDAVTQVKKIEEVPSYLRSRTGESVLKQTVIEVNEENILDLVTNLRIGDKVTITRLPPQFSTLAPRRSLVKYAIPVHFAPSFRNSSYKCFEGDEMFRDSAPEVVYFLRQLLVTCSNIYLAEDVTRALGMDILDEVECINASSLYPNHADLSIQGVGINFSSSRKFSWRSAFDHTLAQVMLRRASLEHDRIAAGPRRGTGRLNSSRSSLARRRWHFARRLSVDTLENGLVEPEPESLFLDLSDKTPLNKKFLTHYDAVRDLTGNDLSIHADAAKGRTQPTTSESECLVSSSKSCDFFDSLIAQDVLVAYIHKFPQNYEKIGIAIAEMKQRAMISYLAREAQSEKLIQELYEIISERNELHGTGGSTDSATTGADSTGGSPSNAGAVVGRRTRGRNNAALSQVKRSMKESELIAMVKQVDKEVDLLYKSLLMPLGVLDSVNKKLKDQRTSGGAKDKRTNRVKENSYCNDENSRSLKKTFATVRDKLQRERAVRLMGSACKAIVLFIVFLILTLAPIVEPVVMLGLLGNETVAGGLSMTGGKNDAKNAQASDLEAQKILWQNLFFLGGPFGFMVFSLLIQWFWVQHLHTTDVVLPPDEVDAKNRVTSWAVWPFHQTFARWIRRAKRFSQGWNQNTASCPDDIWELPDAQQEEMVLSGADANNRSIQSVLVRFYKKEVRDIAERNLTGPCERIMFMFLWIAFVGQLYWLFEPLVDKTFDQSWQHYEIDWYVGRRFFTNEDNILDSSSDNILDSITAQSSSWLGGFNESSPSGFWNLTENAKNATETLTTETSSNAPSGYWFHWKSIPFVWLLARLFYLYTPTTWVFYLWYDLAMTRLVTGSLSEHSGNIAKMTKDWADLMDSAKKPGFGNLDRNLKNEWYEHKLLELLKKNNLPLAWAKTLEKAHGQQSPITDTYVKIIGFDLYDKFGATRFKDARAARSFHIVVVRNFFKFTVLVNFIAQAFILVDDIVKLSNGEFETVAVCGGGNSDSSWKNANGVTSTENCFKFGDRQALAISLLSTVLLLGIHAYQTERAILSIKGSAFKWLPEGVDHENPPESVSDMIRKETHDKLAMASTFEINLTEDQLAVKKEAGKIRAMCDNLFGKDNMSRLSNKIIATVIVSAGPIALPQVVELWRVMNEN